MNIVIISTEAVPFAKTGGLADVCGALPVQLAQRGHQVSLIMPGFRQIRAAGRDIEETDLSVRVSIDGREIAAKISRSTLPDSDVPVYFINQPELFDRAQLYGDEKGDYRDNCLRFAFFSRACLGAITRLDLQPDIVHCNDWQTGLVPAYIAEDFEQHPWMNRAASLMTIHNMAYQGVFPKENLSLTGFDWGQFHHNGLEFYDQINLLKTGIQYADTVTTVSARYAEEIQTEEHGCGLQGVLQARSESLFGVPNGIDTGIWNPQTDPHLAANYSLDNWAEGKNANKRAIQERFGMEVDHEAPVIGLVGRLAEQKGWELVIESMQHFLASGHEAQWVVLGTGAPHYHDALTQLAEKYSGRLGLHLGFSDALAHQIEAASDIFLMPSRYEPCGLNQLYSLRYGTVPVVNPTGGLADTVVDTCEQTLADKTSSGFYLSSFDAPGLTAALSKALRIRSQEPEKWSQIVTTGMQQDWSWGRSADRYVQIYGDTAARKGRKVRI